MRSKIVLILMLVLLITSCVSTHRFYEGPDRPARELAILKGERPIILYGINGQAGPNRLCGSAVSEQFGRISLPSGCYNAFPDYGNPGGFKVELLPGSYTFEVTYFQISRGVVSYSFYTEGCILSDGIKATFCFKEINANLKPGRIYEIRAIGGGILGLQSWFPSVVDVTEEK